MHSPTGIHSINALYDAYNLVHLQKKTHMNPAQYIAIVAETLYIRK